jgi:hypothetical protein
LIFGRFSRNEKRRRRRNFFGRFSRNEKRRRKFLEGLHVTRKEEGNFLEGLHVTRKKNEVFWKVFT